MNIKILGRMKTRVRPHLISLSHYYALAYRLPVSNSKSRLSYIYPNRPLPFDFLRTFLTFRRCFSWGTFCRKLSPFSDRSCKPIVEDTDERDLRAVGLNPAILLFRVAAYIRSHPDSFCFTLLLSLPLCLWISARDCRWRQTPLTINLLIDDELIAWNYPHWRREEKEKGSRAERENCRLLENFTNVLEKSN